MKRVLLSLLLILVLLAGCSLAPVQPVTRKDLMGTGVFQKYVIEESPEELLYSLNTRGEVVITAVRNTPNRQFNVYVKLLATANGVHVLEYDR
jgi:uncharacterized protein YcfL